MDLTSEAWIWPSVLSLDFLGFHGLALHPLLIPFHLLDLLGLTSLLDAVCSVVLDLAFPLFAVLSCLLPLHP